MATFSKPAKSVEQQLELLKQRGLSVRQPERALRFLEVVSFFRLSIYMRPFQIPNDKEHRFKPNSEFKDIINLYAFDRELRLLVIDAIERVEVAVRASLNNYMSCKYQNDNEPHSGTHWYLNRLLFKKNYDYHRLINDLENTQLKEASQLQRDIEKIVTMMLNISYDYAANFIRVVMPFADTPQVTPQATDPATDPAADLATSLTEQVLAFCQQPKSRAEIQEHLGLKHRRHFRTTILNPLLDSGLLLRTLPDKPTSPKQQFYTAQGEYAGGHVNE